MGESFNHKADRHSRSEDPLGDQLINKMLVMSAVVAVLAFASAQLRAFHIGRTYRDSFQLSAVAIVVMVALILDRLVCSKETRSS